MATNTPTMGLVKPDTNDKTEDTIAALANNFERLDKAASWVGMIIQSTRLIVPSEIYGGTWTPLQGRMLVGAGTDFPAGTTGGSAAAKVNSSAWGFQSGLGVSAPGESYGVHEHAGAVDSKSNMPPYRAVYMWERTA